MTMLSRTTKHHTTQHITLYSRRVIKIFIVLLPFTAAFAIHPWVPLPLGFLLLSLPVTVVFILMRGKIRISRFVFDGADICLLLFVMFVLLSSFACSLRQPVTQQKNINHILALCTVLFTYYFYTKLLFSMSQTGKTFAFQQFMKVLTCAFFFMVFYTLIEFICVNFTEINIDRFIYYPDISTGRGRYAGFLKRAHGFAAEPSGLGMLLNLLGPISIGHLICSRKTLLSLCAILGYIAALIVTFSAGAIGTLVIGLLIAFCVYLFDMPITRIKSKQFLLISTILLVAIFGFRLVPDTYKRGIIKKITFSGGPSVEGRLKRWQNAVGYIRHNFWGIGFGTISVRENTGVVSFYLKIIVEAGIISFCIYLLFLFMYLVKILSFSRYYPMKYFYLISYISLCGRYAISGSWWHPWFWFLLALISYDTARLKIMGSDKEKKCKYL